MPNDTQSRMAKRSTPNKKGPKNKPAKKRSAGSLILKIIGGLVIAGCIAFLSGLALFAFYAKDAPELSEKKLDAPASTKFFASNGDLIMDLGAENREKIAPQDVPQLLEDAIVSVEDRRFYKHIGVDPIRIIGSALSNVTSGGLQGGSTLTQQLIKLSFFSTKASDQTLRRKAQEAWLALKLEQQKSKQEILTYYINKVYLSNGIYGMQTAAKTYYGKELKDLSLAQTALIVGLPQAPSYYDPYQNPEQAKERRDTVLYTMLNNKKITESEYKKAKDTKIDDGLVSFDNLKKKAVNSKIADNYIKEAIAEVSEKTGKDVYTDGLEVHLNIDMAAQERLYKIVNTDDYVNYPDKDMQVASTLVDTNTGKVLAQIGGRNIADDVVFGNNLAVSTARDFGSTMKPVTDYGPAFQELQYSPGRRIADEPYQYTGTDIDVKNWDNQYMGNITLRTALYESRNVPATKLFDEVGADKVASFLKGLGISYKSIVQSNAISSNTDTQDGTKYGASSLKMAAAYAAFANGGTYYKPQYVSKIVYQDGSTDEFKPEGQKAMDKGTAYMVTDVLKDVITKGTGTNALIDGLYQAGKTGTSNYTDDELEKIGQTQGVYPDITFVGYTPQYALSVWTGYNKKLTPITDASTHVASDVYRELMQYVSADSDNQDWTIPNDLIRIDGELYWKDNYQTQVAPSSSSAPASSVLPSSSSSSSTSSTTSETTESSSSEEPVSSSTSQPESVPSSSSESSAETQPSSSASAPPDGENNTGNNGNNGNNGNENNENNGNNADNGDNENDQQ